MYVIKTLCNSDELEESKINRKARIEKGERGEGKCMQLLNGLNS